MTTCDTMKSLLGGAALATILTATAIAQEAPILQGNYSANIERANPVGGPPAPAANVIVSTPTNTYGFPTLQDERPLENYSANITLFDLQGR